MAVMTTNHAAPGGARRVLVGANVVLTTAFVIVVLVLVQFIGFKIPTRYDWTSSRINSLSVGSVNLLKGLSKDVHLTSLYFKTSPESEDQQRYRRTVDDLLELFASTNRSLVTTDWINPASEPAEREKLIAKLREIPVFKSELAQYEQPIRKFTEELRKRLVQTIQSELDEIGAMGGVMQDEAVQKTVGPVEELLSTWSQRLIKLDEQIAADSLPPNPRVTAAVEELKSTYRLIAKSLSDIGAHGKEVIRRNPGLPEAQQKFLGGAIDRYSALIGDLETELKVLDELKPPRFDDVVRELSHGNPILVHTADDARVVDFSSVFPPMDQGQGGRGARFADRAFKGEETLTSVILHVTHQEQTAVMFVRFGGAPLFAGGMAPGQPGAPYAAMKQQMEDANFVVEEWDLKTAESPPDINPKPSRTIFIVFKPAPVPGGPFGQQQGEVPFGESHRKAVLDAIGPKGRAMFCAGWFPGPFGPMPSTYEYNAHLKEKWGVEVDTSTLLIQVSSVEPGKYNVRRRDWFTMDVAEKTDHEIMHGSRSSPTYFPWCSPLTLSSAPPANIQLDRLIVQPKKDGVWGVKNLEAYEKQQTDQKYLTLATGDAEGPFTLAVAAKSADAKVVVVSARDFAVDSVAFASAPSLTSDGLVMRLRNPGNITLILNSLHWLNDNSQLLNLGKPVEANVLNIESASSVTWIRVLTMFLWPSLALACGGVAWFLRRR